MKNTVLSNLAALEGERGRLDEKRLYELSELSVIVAQRIYGGKISLGTPYAFADGVDTLVKTELEREQSVPEYLPLLRKSEEWNRIWENAAFSLFLSERMEKSSFSPFPLSPIGGKSARVAYVPSALAETAFARVAKERREASVLYVGGAAEACAAVNASEADYALLPLSYQGTERLSAMEKLVERYKMYITAVIPVSSEDKDALFGLFSLSLAPFKKTDEKYLEWQCTAKSYYDAAKTVSVLSLFGYTLVQYGCTPLEYGRVSVRAVLHGKGDDKALWFFLSLAAGDFTLLGVYPSL